MKKLPKHVREHVQKQMDTLRKLSSKVYRHPGGEALYSALCETLDFIEKHWPREDGP